MTPAQVEEAVKVDPDEWKTELASIEEWFANFGDSLPDALQSGARRPEVPAGLSVFLSTTA
jgi:GTP-dependent phosphoenolpyruvate carboxykinase